MNVRVFDIVEGRENVFEDAPFSILLCFGVTLYNLHFSKKNSIKRIIMNFIDSIQLGLTLELRRV